MVGIPHEHLSEVPALFVVSRADQKIEIDLLLAYCRSNVAFKLIPGHLGNVGSFVLAPARGASQDGAGNAIGAEPACFK